jgi:hypothetical protein
MSPENLIDTLLNITAFAFIGFLIWLYFKKEPEGSQDESQDGNENN